MPQRTRAIVVLAAAALAAAACTPADDATARHDARRADARAQGAASPAPDTTPAANARGATAEGLAARADEARSRSASGASRTAPTAAVPERTKSTPARRVEVGGIDLTGVGYDVGDPAAPVVVVNFSDFGCPFCRSFARETYPTLEREYVRTGKVLFKYVPFVMGMFPNGQHAARAAECAADQGRFWSMHDSLYAQQAEWRKASAPESVFRRDVVALGLDRARFDACYASRDVHPRTRRANEIADDLGIRATPSFVVNDRPIEGALPIADFRRVIEAAILLAAVRP